MRQGSFLVTLTATSLPPQLSPFTAIGSFASGCGKCGQDGRSWRPLCVPVTAALGMEWVQKKGLRSALVQRAFCCQSQSPAVCGCVSPHSLPLSACSTGLSGFWAEPVQGVSSLVWRSGMGEPQAVVVKLWVPALFTSDMLAACDSCPAWVAIAPTLC